MPDLIPWTQEWKKAELLKLWSEWEQCTRCPLYEKRANIVFGSGNPNADIMIIGEIPNEREDLTGEPFCDVSGELLRGFLELLDFESYFMTNIVMCRPPENRKATSHEKNTCCQRLYKEIYIIDPLVIIAAGKEAFKALAGARAQSIAKAHNDAYPCIFPGRKMEITYDVVPIFHPEQIIRMDKRYTSGPKKGQWKEGGMASTVYGDLAILKENLDNLKNNYQKVAEKYS